MACPLFGECRKPIPGVWFLTWGLNHDHESTICACRVRAARCVAQIDQIGSRVTVGISE